MVEPPAPIENTSAPVVAKCRAGKKPSSARPEVIWSLAWQMNLPSRFDRQLVSPISRAKSSIWSNRSRQAAYRSILWVVTSAPTDNGSCLRNSTAAR